MRYISWIIYLASKTHYQTKFSPTTRNHNIPRGSSEVINQMFARGVFTQRSNRENAKIKLRGKKISFGDKQKIRTTSMSFAKSAKKETSK